MPINHLTLGFLILLFIKYLLIKNKDLRVKKDKESRSGKTIRYINIKHT